MVIPIVHRDIQGLTKDIRINMMHMSGVTFHPSD
jgi:hypothetical protein